MWPVLAQAVAIAFLRYYAGVPGTILCLGNTFADRPQRMPGQVETPAYLLRALGNGAVTGDGVSEATRRAQRVSRLSSWAQLRQGAAAAELERHGGAGGREGGGMGQVPALPPGGVRIPPLRRARRPRTRTILRVRIRKFPQREELPGGSSARALPTDRRLRLQVTGVAISEGAAGGQRYSTVLRLSSDELGPLARFDSIRRYVTANERRTRCSRRTRRSALHCIHRLCIAQARVRVPPRRAAVGSGHV